MSAPEQAVLLYCRCAYAQVVPSGVKNAVLQQLCESGAGFETVSDLCEMAAHRDPRLQELSRCGRLRVAACYPRAVTGLFHQAGASLPPGTEILNMRTQTAEEIVAQMLAPAGQATSTPPAEAAETAPAAPATDIAASAPVLA